MYLCSDCGRTYDDLSTAKDEFGLNEHQCPNCHSPDLVGASDCPMCGFEVIPASHIACKTCTEGALRQFREAILPHFTYSEMLLFEDMVFNKCLIDIVYPDGKPAAVHERPVEPQATAG